MEALFEVAAPPLDPWFRTKVFGLGFDRHKRSGLARVIRTVPWMLFTILMVVQHPLARSQKLRSLGLMLKAQRLRKRRQTYLLDLGADGQMVCPPFSALGSLNAATGSQEPWEHSLSLDLVRPGEGVIDAGANLGFFGIPLALRGAQVLAFEPARQAVEVLRLNARLNGISRSVKVLEYALSDFDGEAFFTEGLDAQNHLVLNPSTQEQKLAPTPVHTLDSVRALEREWFEQFGLVLLKVDVEGQDMQVLNGARRILDEFRPIVMIETRAGGTEVRAHLSEMGYRFFWYRLKDFTVFEIPDDWSGNRRFHSNIFAVPEEKLSWFADRVNKGPHHRAAPAVAIEPYDGQL